MPKQSAFYHELQTMLEKPGCPLCHVAGLQRPSGFGIAQRQRTELNEAQGSIQNKSDSI